MDTKSKTVAEPNTPTPEKVKMRCTNHQSGKIGEIATPLKKDQKAWEQAGWELVKAAEKAK